MANIKTLVQPFASEAVIQAAVDAVNQNTPPHIIPAAQVMRDANGKVVEVVVNLPADIASSDLKNAESALNNLPDVAKATAYPKNLGEGSFDSLTPGEVLTVINIGTVEAPVSAPLSNESGSQWVAALATDAVGGSGSALELKDTNASYGRTAGGINIPANSLGLADIGAFNLKFSMKCPQDITLGGSYRMSTFVVYFGSHFLEVKASDRPANQTRYWDRLLIDGEWGIQNNTTVCDSEYVTFEMSQDLSGRLSIKVNDVEKAYKPLGFVYRAAAINIPMTDQVSGATSQLMPSVFIDNLEFTILS